MNAYEAFQNTNSQEEHELYLHENSWLVDCWLRTSTTEWTEAIINSI